MPPRTAERYTIAEEPAGDAYAALLRFALGHCNAGILVLRNATEIGPAAAGILKRIGRSIISKEEAAQWPGTRLIDHTATVCRFEYNDIVCDALTKATDHLYGWMEPELPEDLCLIRPDGRPWLVCISHEHDGYLDLDPGEYKALITNVWLRLILETSH